jgi:hypothetical protein
MTEENKNKVKNYNTYVIGINVGVLAVYTVISRALDGGFIIDAFFIAAQFFCCVIIGLGTRKWIWAMTAFLILLIGFSTCVNFLNMQM